MNKALSRTFLAPALLLAVACQQSPTDPVPTEADLAALEADGAAPEADEPLPVPGPSFELETADGKTALRWVNPPEEDEVASDRIGREGGKVEISNVGLSLRVPEDALSTPTTLTVTVPAGEDMAFRFGPHGTQFDVPVAVWFDVGHLANGDALKDLAKEIGADGHDLVAMGSMTAVYYAEQDGEIVSTIEEFTVYMTEGAYLVFFTEHFSGYALAW